MKSQAERSYRWLFWGLVVLGLALDQGSKYGIFAALYDEALQDRDRQARVEVIPGAFSLTASFTLDRDDGTGLLGPLRTWGGAYLPQVNRGALFGVGSRHEDGGDSNFLFLLVSLGAAVAITAWSARRTACRDFLLSVSLGLILAGTLGNLYDRVVFDGVRDFLWWYKWFNWPVFNVADCCLVCGAGLLLWQALGSRTANDPAAVTAAVAASVGGQASHSPSESAPACNP
jgi:lipoprotein signal peptidase